MSRFDEDLRNALNPEQPPDGFTARVLSRTTKQEALAVASEPRGIRTVEWIGIAAVTVLAVAVTVLPMLTNREVEAPPVQTPAAPAPADLSVPEAARDVPQRTPQIPDTPKNEKTLSNRGVEVKTLFSSGIEAMKAGRYVDAGAFFQQAAQLDPNQDVIFANLGEALNSGRRYAEAAEAYRKAIDLNPIEPGYVGNLSLILANAGRWDEAYQAAEKCAQLDPQNAAQAYFKVGAVFQNRGRDVEARRAFNKSLEHDPFKAEAVYELAIASLYSAETMKDAGPLFSRFLVLSPEGVDAERARGFMEDWKKLMAEGGNLNDAYLRKMIELNGFGKKNK